jgi:uncharacterized protein
MKKKSFKSAADEEGLRFECQQGCIKCCAIPGMIFVKEEELPTMAEYFKLSEEEFIEKYILKYFGGVYRLNCDEEAPCMFLEETGCGIYPVRPAQCRTFPFWPENINNPKNWFNLKKMCPGIGKGRLYTIDEITDIAAEVSYGPFLI